MTTELSFRPLRRADFLLLQKWLAAPHVAAWWNDPFDLPSLEAKYGPRIDGTEAVYVYVIQHNSAPIGWIQWYRWSDYPQHATQLGADSSAAGIDLAIGEFDKTGLGLGPSAIRDFVRNFVFVNSDVSSVVTDPAETNQRSVGAFKKAGFMPVRLIRLAEEDFARQVVRLDR
jgi:aminoglycoside 6'-N-acetyltransferase